MVGYLYKRTIRELRKIKYRAVGSAVLIIISASIFIAISGMVPTAQKAMEEKVQALNLHDLLVHVREANETEISELATIPEIKTAEARLVVSSRISIKNQDSSKNLTAIVYGINSESVPKVDSLELFTTDSSYFAENDSDVVIVERNFALREDIKVSDEVYINTAIGLTKLTVKGIVVTPEYLTLPTNPQAIMPLPGSMAVVYVPISWLRYAFGFPNAYVNEFIFSFSNRADRKQLETAITERLSSHVIVYSIPWEKTEFAFLKDHIGNSPISIIAGVFLLVAFVIVYISFARIVQEQRREIGVLRALGYSRGAVLRSYLFMAILIGVVASILGFAVGLPLSLLLGDFYSKMFIGTSATSFIIVPNSVFIGFLFGPITTTLACVMAVWSTVTMDPQDAIKGTPRTFIKGWRNVKVASDNKNKKAPKGSYLIHYTMKNMSRHRIRTIFTVVAVGGTMILGSMAFFMMASFNNSMEYGLRDYEKWDILVEFTYPLNETMATQVTSPSITAYAYISRIAGEWQKDNNSGTTLIVGLDSNQELHNFKINKGVKANGPSEAMFNTKIAEDNGIAIGDIIQIKGFNGTIPVKITAFVEDFIGGLFVDMQAVKDITGQKVYNGMYVKTVADETNNVKKTFLASPLVTDAMTLSETSSGLREYFNSYGSLFYVITLIGVVVITPTLANIVFVEVLERYPEYGQLMAIGYSKWSVAKIVISEIFLTVTAGVIIGAPMTYYFLSYFESAAKSSIPIYSTIIYPSDWISYIGVSLLIYLIALLAALPSIRHVNKMDIAKTISERFG